MVVIGLMKARSCCQQIVTIIQRTKCMHCLADWWLWGWGHMDTTWHNFVQHFQSYEQGHSGPHGKAWTKKRMDKGGDSFCPQWAFVLKNRSIRLKNKKLGYKSCPKVLFIITLLGIVQVSLIGSTLQCLVDNPLTIFINRFSFQEDPCPNSVVNSDTFKLKATKVKQMYACFNHHYYFEVHVVCKPCWLKVIARW